MNDDKLVFEIDQLMNVLSLEDEFKKLLETDYALLAETLAEVKQTHDGALLVGINGAQGAGKTTLCRFLKLILSKRYGLNSVTVSIDDFYLGHGERQELATKIHPLFKTRGVPGTHDVGLGIHCLEQLKQLAVGDIVSLPQFNKANDDCLPRSEWPSVEGLVDIILFEGWCVAAIPEMQSDLMMPVNQLEREEDEYEDWRQYVNQKLAEEYQDLFALIDYLVMLKVPSMAFVLERRKLQESKLRESLGSIGQQRLMADIDIERFVMHFERLTRHMLHEMPERADYLIEL